MLITITERTWHPVCLKRKQIWIYFDIKKKTSWSPLPGYILRAINISIYKNMIAGTLFFMTMHIEVDTLCRKWPIWISVFSEGKLGT